MSNYVAFIPARGGSKGIPGKNIKPLLDKPLIGWSIEQALQCAEISDVYVSTDSPEIQRVALDFGARAPFVRPAQLSGDTATTESAVLHFIDWMTEQGLDDFENIVLMQATSPIRKSGVLAGAIRQFERDRLDSLVTVARTHKFFWKDPVNPQASYDIFQRPRRQDIKPEDVTYFENGSFYITSRSIYAKYGNRLGGKIGLYEMSAEESVEIDDPFDFAICEMVLAGMRESDADQ